jgi:hypothetical protein
VGEKCCLPNNAVKEPEVNHKRANDFMRLRIRGKTYAFSRETGNTTPLMTHEAVPKPCVSAHGQ